MNHILVSHLTKQIAAKGDGVLVMIDYKKHSKVPIPKKILEIIQDTELYLSAGRH